MLVGKLKGVRGYIPDCICLNSGLGKGFIYRYIAVVSYMALKNRYVKGSEKGVSYEPMYDLQVYA